MLSVAKHLFAIALDSNLPATARSGNVRAERHNIDAALWIMGIVRAEHKPLRSVQGFGGLLRGIRGLLRN